MKFNEFKEKFKEDTGHDPNVNSGVNLVEDKAIKFWTSYQIAETNTKLVQATWALAITTIILITISLFAK